MDRLQVVVSVFAWSSRMVRTVNRLFRTAKTCTFNFRLARPGSDLPILKCIYMRMVRCTAKESHNGNAATFNVSLA